MEAARQLAAAKPWLGLWGVAGQQGRGRGGTAPAGDQPLSVGCEVQPHPYWFSPGFSTTSIFNIFKEIFIFQVQIFLLLWETTS